MRIRLCGVRGSTPAPGPEFVRVGGNTSCLAIAHDDGPWRLIIDAGTGLNGVTAQLRGAPFDGTVLLGHLHLDHTQGLPFFAAADRRGARTHVVVPAQQGTDAETLLDRLYSPPHFPIRLRDLRGTWTFDSIEAGVHELEGFTIEAADVPHGGGRTLGYRISDGRSSIAYLSDHGPADIDALAPAIALARDVDVLLHDSQFTPDEQTRFASIRSRHPTDRPRSGGQGPRAPADAHPSRAAPRRHRRRSDGRSRDPGCRRAGRSGRSCGRGGPRSGRPRAALALNVRVPRPHQIPQRHQTRVARASPPRS